MKRSHELQMYVSESYLTFLNLALLLWHSANNDSTELFWQQPDAGRWLHTAVERCAWRPDVAQVGKFTAKGFSGEVPMCWSSLIDC